MVGLNHTTITISKDFKKTLEQEKINSSAKTYGELIKNYIKIKEEYVKQKKIIPEKDREDLLLNISNNQKTIARVMMKILNKLEENDDEKNN